MAPTGVRDCVADQFFEVGLLQADASRRQSGPRKTIQSLSTVRFRSKSCLVGNPDGYLQREKVISGKKLRGLQQADVGSKIRSARWVSYLNYSATRMRCGVSLFKENCND
jgi:hypothetical protein